MSEDRFGRLEVSEADYLANKELQTRMEDEGEVCTYNGVTEVCNSEASWGCFYDLEEFCITNQIAFQRFTEQSLEGNGFYRIYRPEREEVPEIDTEIPVDVNQETFVSCSILKSILFGYDFKSDKEKLQKIENTVMSFDFPCPLLGGYRVESEREGGVSA